jgi:hypothetical protein
MTDKLRAEDTVPTVGADLLRGVPKIAEFIGENARKTYYLLEQRRIPAGKEGALWVSGKQALREHYRRLIAAAE